MKVLVVVDDAVSLEYLQRVCASRSHEVIACKDGAAALQLVKEHRPDCIVSDYCMPDVSGTDLCAAIRAKCATEGWPRIYFVLSTAQDPVDARAAAVAGAVDDFITKPFSPESIAARLTLASRILRLQ